MEGIATGIKQLDSTFNGLKIGKLYCISATSSLERSSLMAKLALGVATRGYGILLCSMVNSETEESKYIDKFAIFQSSRDERSIFNRRGIKIIPLEGNIELSLFEEYKLIHVTFG